MHSRPFVDGEDEHLMKYLSPLTLVVITYKWRGAPFDFDPNVSPPAEIVRRIYSVQSLIFVFQTSRTLIVPDDSPQPPPLADTDDVFDGCPLYSTEPITFNEAARIILGAKSIPPDKYVFTI